MAFFHFLKALFIPLAISAVLYLFLFHFAIPLYRRHRARYSQYLPVSLANSSAARLTDTTSLRSRVTESLFSILSTYRHAGSWFGRTSARSRVVNGANGEDSDDEEELSAQRMSSRVRTTDALGDEELDEAVWDGTDGRRDALDPRATRSRSRSDSGSRLSIDLEQGFRDSSDEEDD